ncbi:MAG: ribonuclease P protein component [Salibacteraceae bacterium]
MPFIIVKNNLPAGNRIKSRDEAKFLFNKGKRLNCFPVRIIYSYVERVELAEFKLMISVPKRIFKKAVDRNKIKRQIKESIRTNKDLLPTKEGKTLIVGVIYNDSEIREFNDLQGRIILSLHKLNKRVDSE